LIQASRGRKELKKEIAGLPQYQQSQGILDYYNQAQQRYGVSPTQTAMYKRQMQNIQRAGATGLAGARGAAARMGAASSIARSLSDATLGAEVAAEQEQNRRFGQLGQAAQLKRGEEMAAFQQNQVLPSQMRLQMASQRAAGGAQVANVGLSNLFGAAQSAATQGLYKDIYGVGGKSGSEFPKGYNQGTNRGMLNLFPTPSTSVPSRLSTASGVTPRATPSVAFRQYNVPRILPSNNYSGSIYPFPTYPY
jgi:hypothetical protein